MFIDLNIIFIIKLKGDCEKSSRNVIKWVFFFYILIFIRVYGLKNNK